MVNVRMAAIFAIIIIAAVAGIAWPFLANIKPVYMVPMQTSQWHMGKGSEYNPEMTYQVFFNKTKFSADMKFNPSVGGNQQLTVKLMPADGGKEIDQTVTLGPVYYFKDVSSDASMYFDVLDQTVFSMRDYATDDKYLAKGAEWGDLYIGENHETLKITDAGKMTFGFGSANAYLLSYRIGANMNKIWIVDNIPLPVKAETYDPNGNLLYTYELVLLKAPATPGLTS